MATVVTPKLNANLDLKTLQQVNWRVLLRTRNFLVLSIAAGVLAAGLTLFLLFVQLPNLVSLISNDRDTAAKLVSLQLKSAQLKDSVLLDQADNRAKIDQLFPSQKPLLPLLNALSQAMQNTGVKPVAVETSPGRIASGSAQLQTNVAQFGAAPAQKINGIDVLTVGVTVDGLLPQINAFVKQIEVVAPMSDITQFQLTSLSDARNKTDQYEAKMQVASYYFAQTITVSVDADLPVIDGPSQAFLTNLGRFQFGSANAQQSIVGGGLNDLFGGVGGVTITPSTQPAQLPATGSALLLAPAALLQPR